ncbi:DUF2779 domain-containing protein [Phenylobacterium sp.]|uniref:DUF2779 domain-containing protein n=1 Tax=Phenylobacterium sp. TaxID=1871053 RepID=UPI003D27B8DF
MLTKSQLMSWRQCPKRLWLERHSPTEPPANAEALRRGQTVGEVARLVFGGPDAVMIDRTRNGAAVARSQTAEMMALGCTLFEAAFGDDELTAYADLARPHAGGWELVEIKDASKVKPHHLDDVAIQAAAARRAGLALKRVSVSHLNTKKPYRGGGDYSDLFTVKDVTGDVAELIEAVDGWAEAAAEVLAAASPPERGTGDHCETPYPCPFHDRCATEEPQVAHPAAWLPGRRSAAAQALEGAGARDMAEFPDDVLNLTQRRVKAQTLAGEIHFDQRGAAAQLAACVFPLHFLDFETVVAPIPLWAGTRPYTQKPFQFSLHILDANGALTHRDCLLTDGEDPTGAFAEALVRACGSAGSIIVYNASFERTRVKELARDFGDLASQLTAINDRMVDLQPVAQAHYYHPDQQGSWSIKKVLPCLVPELRYDLLDGVQNGTAAIDAYLELTHPECAPDRKAALEDQLRRYCHLDTLAMIAVWARFTGNIAALESTLDRAPKPLA